MSLVPLSGAAVAPGGAAPASPARAELRWLAVVTSLVLLLVEIPYLIAYSHAAHGIVFTGMLWSPHDFAQYGAAMREAARSPSWLIHAHLTDEPHDPALIYPLYAGLGKLAGLLSLDAQPVYHAAEIAARVVLLMAIYRLCAMVFCHLGQRRAAFILIALSSGLGFWLTLLHAALPVRLDRPELLVTDFNWPEVSTFLALFTAPHLILGLAFLLLAACFYLRCWHDAGFRAPTSGALAALGLGLTNPFSLVTLCTVLTAHLAAMWACHRRLPRAAVLGAAAVGLASAPSLLYNLLVFGADPFWSAAYGRQNVLPSPPPWSFALGVGPIVALAILGVPSFWRGATPERGLVLTWIGVSIALMYAPVSFQRRFAFGLQPMLALVAASGLAVILGQARHSRVGWRSLGRGLLDAGLFCALFASSASYYALTMHAATSPAERSWQSGAFQPDSLQEAGRWLAGVMAPDEVVLADTLTGNYLAAVVPGRVFVGHWVGTLRFEEKQAAMRAFYRAQDDASQHRFLADNNIRYVVYGPHERAQTPQKAAGPHLLPIYATSDVSIYRVEIRPSNGR